MAKKKIQPGPDLLMRVETAFLSRGYDDLSMIDLAQACGFSTRSLYNYFDHKEEAFRAVISWRNQVAMAEGLAAGRAQKAAGAGPLDIFGETVNVRYGSVRRVANASPHVIALAAEVATRCNDIVTEVATTFQVELAQLLRECEADRLLSLQDDVTLEQAAQALADGARGVNQHLPPPAPGELAGRYRQMCRFVLSGCAEIPARRRRGRPKRVAVVPPHGGTP